MFFTQPEFREFKNDSEYLEWLSWAHRHQENQVHLSFNYNEIEARLQSEHNNKIKTFDKQ